MRATLLAMACWALIAVPAAAPAQAILRSIELGDGMSVHAVAGGRGVCGLTIGPCFVWHAVGLDIERMDAVLIAHTFVRVPGTPRVLAAVPNRAGVYRNAGILYTDDRGASWSAASWPSANVARAIAFDPTGALGVAVGPSLGIWITTDRGEHWLERSSSAGLSYVDVAVVGQTAVIVDEARNAWRTRDRGFSLDSVIGEVSAPLRQRDGAIVVESGAHRARVLADGTIRRE